MTLGRWTASCFGLALCIYCSVCPCGCLCLHLFGARDINLISYNKKWERFKRATDHNSDMAKERHKHCLKAASWGSVWVILSVGRVVYGQVIRCEDRLWLVLGLVLSLEALISAPKSVKLAIFCRSFKTLFRFVALSLCRSFSTNPILLVV